MLCGLNMERSLPSCWGTGAGRQAGCYPLNEWCVSSCFALKILFALAIRSSILSNCICPHTDANTISVNWLSPVSLKKSQTHLWPHIQNSIFCMLPIVCAYLMISSSIFLSRILWFIYTYIYISFVYISSNYALHKSIYTYNIYMTMSNFYFLLYIFLYFKIFYNEQTQLL